MSTRSLPLWALLATWVGCGAQADPTLHDSDSWSPGHPADPQRPAPGALSLVLPPNPIELGALTSALVSGAQPGATVALLASRTEEPGPCPPQLDTCLDIGPTLYSLGSITADNAGNAQLRFTLPCQLPVSSLAVQAVAPNGGVDSDTSAPATVLTTAGAACTVCGIPDPLGPWGGSFPHPLWGSTITTQPYVNDSGLDQVIAAWELGERDLSANPIAVSGTHVINVGYRSDGGDLWLEDANAALNTWFDLGGLFTPSAPGDTLSFEVTEVGDYLGQPQITNVQNFSIDTTGEPVRVLDGMGRPLDWAIQGPRNSEVYGEVVNAYGQCPWATSDHCYTLDHGGTQTLFSLSPVAYVFYPGDCVHLIAPLSHAEGIPVHRLTNWDWWTFF